MSASRKQCARDFAACWTARRGSEKGEDQQFWNMLLRDVLGVADCERHIRYQVPVPMRGTTKFLDAWIPETRVLIEHKSRGVNLDAPQPGHGGLTPYEQAAEYDNARAFDEKARWIVTCNFDEFRIYDRAKPLAPPLTLKLANLPKEAYRLEFLVNPKEKAIDRELEISVQAGRIVGEIYDALLGQYCGGRGAPALPDDGRAGSPLPADEHLAALNRLCVRLVFCLYAEDAGIFPKDCFRRLMENTPAPFLRERLKKLFEVLDTPRDRRDPYLEAELSVFPYTNGGLFKFRQCENAGDIPPVTEDIRRLLVGASRFDWRDITPTVFGALFESTLNPATRRAGGMVYTSVENIHKVIGPLFLDDLARRVNECIALPPSPSRNKRLLAVRDEMAALSFLDPACGSGNFLTESYICLRRLENRIIAALQQGQGELDLGASVKVSVAQFHGIEINDFAAAVAKTALWIAEAQMLQETAEILHREPDFLPLKDYASIVEGNALRMDWSRTGLPPPEIPVAAIGGTVRFRDAKVRLTELKNGKAEAVNAAGDRFRFTKQIFKALSDKARDKSVSRPVHWAAVAAIDKLCEASAFLWDEKPRNGSADIERYAKHGACFTVEGEPFVAKITSKVYTGGTAHATYSVEAVAVEKNDARGMTDSIARGQSLDPGAADRLLKFSKAVKAAFAKKTFDFIMGNPPFVGARNKSKEQAADMEAVFGAKWQGIGNLDYVTAWYKKAVDCMVGRDDPIAPQTRCAFVSTNSICQGDGVSSLWKPLFAQGLEIDFAHRTFRWDNEAFDKAHVHCVIIGFHAKDEKQTDLLTSNGVRNSEKVSGVSREQIRLLKSKTIFDGDHAIPAANICPYLIDAPTVFIESRAKPICDVPQMTYGNKPTDDGNLILSEAERQAILHDTPALTPFIRRYVGSRDFINAYEVRYCLWLKDVSPAAYHGNREVMRRLTAVRDFRLASSASPTRKMAEQPWQFFSSPHTESPYLLVPEVSSERRRYVPIGFMDANVIAANTVSIVPNATVYHFGVLTSSAHMAWMRVVAGRLKSDYRYSGAIVYNNFPWPDDSVNPAKEKIVATAQAILDARTAHSDCSFAVLYDPLTMPPGLRAAHEVNDRAVLAAYGLAPDTPEPEIVAHLFGLYAEMMNKK